jgi:hypothetical protein
VGHVARIVGKPEGNYLTKNIGVEEKMILSFILKMIMLGGFELEESG